MSASEGRREETERGSASMDRDRTRDTDRDNDDGRAGRKARSGA